MDNTGNFLLYAGKDGNIKVQIIIGEETVWASQKSMAEIFNVEVPAISKHISNIYESEELVEASTVSKMEIVQQAINTPLVTKAKKDKE